MFRTKIYKYLRCWTLDKSTASLCLLWMTILLILGKLSTLSKPMRWTNHHHVYKRLTIVGLIPCVCIQRIDFIHFLSKECIIESPVLRLVQTVLTSYPVSIDQEARTGVDTNIVYSLKQLCCQWHPITWVH